MKIYIFRHGEAEDIGKNGVYIDEARRLTEKGQRDAQKMGAYLKAKQHKVDLFLHSPLVRAVTNIFGSLRKSQERAITCNRGASADFNKGDCNAYQR